MIGGIIIIGVGIAMSLWLGVFLIRHMKRGGRGIENVFDTIPFWPGAILIAFGGILLWQSI